MKSRKKINFFIVGVAKSGTSSMHNYLQQHPKIFMSPVKETYFFSKDLRIENFKGKIKKNKKVNKKKYFSNSLLPQVQQIFIKNIEDYYQIFREAKNEKILGESCPGYLYSQLAAKEIYQYNPKAKIMIMLRDPVERAYSNFMMQLENGLLKTDYFLEEVKKDYNQNDKGWGRSHLFIESGLYYKPVKRYLDLFPQNNVKIILFNDFIKKTNLVLSQVCDFLDIEKFNFMTKKAHMKSQKPKFLFLYNQVINLAQSANLLKIVPESLRERIKKMFMKEKPKLTEEERKTLRPYFKEDILKLQNLIGKDLSDWLK
ncbi:MAG: sulfotransferase [Patescibacteria group bacterium]|nr:sulfotransferase [Patescibacteria group bacterium]